MDGEGTHSAGYVSLVAPGTLDLEIGVISGL
jgi:hypothetical protein